MGAGVGTLIKERRQERGHNWTQRQLAKAAGVSLAEVQSIEQGRRQPKWDALQALAHALGLDPYELLHISHGESAASRRQILTELAGSVAEFGYEVGDGPGKSHGSAPLSLEVPLDVLAEIGVRLQLWGRSREGSAILSYLVGQGGVLPVLVKQSNNVTLRVAAAVASAHLAHYHLDRGDYARSEALFQFALGFLGDDGMTGQRGEHEVWERYQQVGVRARKDFELWCFQMIGVAKRMSNEKRPLQEAVGHLLYVAQEAKRGQMDPNLVRGNALRDLATAQVQVSPSSPLAGAHLNESIMRLADAPDPAMLAMSLLKRAQWHKVQHNTSDMERDVIAGLAVCPEDASVVYSNVLNTVAAMYLDLEPALAGRLAREAQRRAMEGGFSGQYQRSETILASLSEGLPP